MERARLRLINEQPFYALFLNKIRVTWNPKIKTAAVKMNYRGELEMHVCREYFDSLDVKRQVGVLMHEMLHIMERHFDRGLGLDNSIGNIAMDLAINCLIHPHLLHDTWLLPEQYGLKRMEGMEQYYLQLLQMIKSGKRHGKVVVTPNGAYIDGEPWDDHDFFTNEAVGAVDVNKIVGDAMESAYNETKHRFPGKEPHNIEKMIRELREKCKVDWKSELRKFVGRNLSDHAQSTRTRANRRFGLAAMGVKRDYVPKVLILCDHSGSVSEDIEAELIAEMQGILKAVGSDKTEVAFFDTEIGVRCKLNKFSEIPPRQKMGGTSFQAAFDYARTIKPDLLVMLTDAGDSMPEPPKFPIVWVIAGGYRTDHLKGKVLIV